MITEDPNKAPATEWEATKDYDGPSAPGFISLKLGEILLEVEPAKNGWIKVKNDKNQEGSVPVDAIRKKIKWKATIDYKMEGQKELISLKKGEIYEEVAPEREHYVKLRSNEGAEGWAPVDCLVKEK